MNKYNQGIRNLRRRLVHRERETRDSLLLTEEIEKFRTTIDAHLGKTAKWDTISKRVTVIASIVSLIVAGIGAFIAWQAKDLQQNAFDANVEPLVISSIIYDKESFHLQLTNAGINPIIDARIWNDMLYYGSRKDAIIASMLGRLSPIGGETIAPGDSFSFTITHDQMDMYKHNRYPIANSAGESVSSCIGIIVFNARYRRVPDKKLYTSRKYLFMLQNGEDTTKIFFHDPDDSPPMLQDFRKRIDSLYTQSYLL